MLDDPDPPIPDESPVPPKDLPGMTHIGRYEGHDAAMEAAGDRNVQLRAVPESWLDEVDVYEIEGPDDAA